MLLVFILITFGLTQLLVYGKIFDKIRPKHYFFGCPMCVGFYVGVFIFCLSPWTELFIMKFNVLNALLAGCLSSGTSYVLCQLFDDGGLKINVGK